MSVRRTHLVLNQSPEEKALSHLYTVYLSEAMIDSRVPRWRLCTLVRCVPHAATLPVTAVRDGAAPGPRQEAGANLPAQSHHGAPRDVRAQRRRGQHGQLRQPREYASPRGQGVRLGSHGACHVWSQQTCKNPKVDSAFQRRVLSVLLPKPSLSTWGSHTEESVAFCVTPLRQHWRRPWSCLPTRVACRVCDLRKGLRWGANNTADSAHPSRCAITVFLHCEKRQCGSNWTQPTTTSRRSASRIPSDSTSRIHDNSVPVSMTTARPVSTTTAYPCP